MTLIKQVIFAGIGVCFTAQAQAFSYALEFSGQLTHGANDDGGFGSELDTPISFSGLIYLDQITGPKQPSGLYIFHPASGQIVVDNIQFDLNFSAGLPLLGLSNNNPNSPAGPIDIFAVAYTFEDSDGNEANTLFQFTTFNTDFVTGPALPGEFNLADLDYLFDPQDPLASFSTVAAINIGGGGLVAFGSYDFVEFRQIPLPAAAWLMISALGALGLFNRFRRV